MFDTQTTKDTPTFAHRRNSPPIMTVRNLSLHYGEKLALDDVSFDLYANEILAFIGPSGCGKSTALKCLNRMHDGARDVRIEGEILMHGEDIHGPDIDPPLHRRRFGWVAQKPNPFPTTIFDNVAYPARLHGLTRNRKALKAHVEQCLRRAWLWDEVAGHLMVKIGTDLSGGQQQRLCIARALSTKPEVLLMDEPTGSIDPIATQRIEDLLVELKAEQAIVIITHSMAQARRIADRVAYFHLGKLLEVQPTEAMFAAPQTAEARAFIAGKMG
ncbi:phosphate ABC transporter ATP-binding protein [Tateyamaria sp. ANG-S1]|uniref:phosphate ABC transporter ATP-binding protein n=1 Tax=Tateyamaria sp. ANG-S1 TaxID=1577905 RepID=UPI000AF3D826|nr:phosphate ABC transporter ATP-binding protein [Tateyamaria sp. ANG-S1]